MPLRPTVVGCGGLWLAVAAVAAAAAVLSCGGLPEYAGTEQRVRPAQDGTPSPLKLLSVRSTSNSSGSASGGGGGIYLQRTASDLTPIQPPAYVCDISGTISEFCTSPNAIGG